MVDGCLAEEYLDGAFTDEYKQRSELWRSSSFFDERYLSPTKGLVYNCAAIAEDLAGWTSVEQLHRALAACDAHMVCLGASLIKRKWHFPGWLERGGRDQQALAEAQDILLQGIETVLRNPRSFNLSLSSHACRYLFWPQHHFANEARKFAQRTSDYCRSHCAEHCDGYALLQRGEVEAWRALCRNKTVLPRLQSYCEMGWLDTESEPSLGINGSRDGDGFRLPWRDDPTVDTDLEQASDRLTPPSQVLDVGLSPGYAKLLDDYALLKEQGYTWCEVGALHDLTAHAARKIHSRNITPPFKTAFENCLLNALLSPKRGGITLSNHAPVVQLYLQRTLATLKGAEEGMEDSPVREGIPVSRLTDYVYLAKDDSPPNNRNFGAAVSIWTYGLIELTPHSSSSEVNRFISLEQPGHITVVVRAPHRHPVFARAQAAYCGALTAAC